MNAQLPLRGSDPWGSGAFGAPRGNHAHEGVDFACWPGTFINAICGGVVTKIGYPYGSGRGAVHGRDPYRYIEVRHDDDHVVRYFYVKPNLMEGEEIEAGEVIGWAQDLWRRFPPKPGNIMTPHVHIEVRDPDGELIDPLDYLVMVTG